jgi:hypothetical protein
MKKLTNLLKRPGKCYLVLPLFALFGLSPVFAQEAATKQVTLKGEVLDLDCYVKNEAKGPDHKSCAAACLKNGNPVGLLASDGKVYLIVPDSKNAQPYQEVRNHAAEQVSITGVVHTRNGLPGIIPSKVATVAN